MQIWKNSKFTFQQRFPEERLRFYLNREKRFSYLKNALMYEELYKENVFDSEDEEEGCFKKVFENMKFNYQYNKEETEFKATEETEFYETISTIIGDLVPDWKISTILPPNLSDLIVIQAKVEVIVYSETAVCESGSQINLIQSKLIPENKKGMIYSSDEKTIFTEKGELLKLTQAIKLRVDYGMGEFRTKFYVVEREDMKNYKLLFGKPALMAMNMYGKIFKFKRDRLLYKE